MSNDGGLSFNLDMSTAPMDGSEIEIINDDGSEDLVFWQDEGRCCMLGPRAGSHPPGWTSIDAGNLPVDSESMVGWRYPTERKR